jgi:hypothetical protein
LATVPYPLSLTIATEDATPDRSSARPVAAPPGQAQVPAGSSTAAGPRGQQACSRTSFTMRAFHVFVSLGSRS